MENILTVGPHQVQYLSFENEIPNETQISLTATGRPVRYQPFELDNYSTVEDVKRSQFVAILSLLSLLYDHEKRQQIVVLGMSNLKAIEYLDNLFPNLKWDLYLMNRKSRKNNIKTYNDIIEPRRLYHNQNLIFISFIKNMKTNLDIYYKLNPLWSLLPFTVDTTETEYLDGHLLNNIWNGKKSCWINILVKRRAGLRLYDKEIYNDTCFSFNADYRARSYPTRVVNVNFDHCYDCAMENSIWELYMLKMERQADTAVIASFMNSLHRNIYD